MSIRYTLPVFVMLAFPVPLCAQADSKNVVVLTFDWPVGLEADVSHHRMTIRSTDGKVDTSAASITYRMHVHSHPAGRLIRYDSLSHPGLPSPRDLLPEHLAERLEVFPLSLVVGYDGLIVDFKGVDQLVELVRIESRQILDSMPSAAAREIVDRVLSPEFFISQAASDWSMLVDMWLDAKFELRAVYKAKDEVLSPIFPDVPIPQVFQYWFTEWTSCSEEAHDTACVVLEMVSFPDPVALAELIESVAGKFAPGYVVRHLDMENHVRPITEPDGMIPHRLEVTQTVSGETESPGKGVEVSSHYLSRLWTFKYRNPND